MRMWSGGKGFAEKVRVSVLKLYIERRGLATKKKKINENKNDKKA